MMAIFPTLIVGLDRGTVESCFSRVRCAALALLLLTSNQALSQILGHGGATRIGTVADSVVASPPAFMIFTGDLWIPLIRSISRARMLS